MMFQRILVPVDFSELDELAVKVATSLARDTGGSLIFVHVEEPPSTYAEGGLYIGEVDPNIDQLRKMLHEIKPSNPSVPHEHRFLTGTPSASIVKSAEKEKADAIVMSTHGRSGLFRVLMGSVAEHVVRRAPCPVLTFRPVVAEGIIQKEASSC